MEEAWRIVLIHVELKCICRLHGASTHVDLNWSGNRKCGFNLFDQIGFVSTIMSADRRVLKEGWREDNMVSHMSAQHRLFLGDSA